MEKRKRNWTCILYLDSTRENFIEILNNSMVEYALSPLHDKDLDNNNILKKAHYHLILKFNGLKSYNQVLDFVNSFSIVNKIEDVISLSGLNDYLTHSTDRNKYQYDVKDIVYGNGFKIDVSRETSNKNSLNLLLNLKNVNDVKSLSELIEILLDNNMNECLDFVIKNSYFVCKFFHF